VLISCAGLENVHRKLQSNDFTFIVAHKLFPCPSFVAEFLSPRVSRLRPIDPTIHEFIFDVDDPVNTFSDYLRLGESLPLNMTFRHQDVLQSISSKLGNHELLNCIFHAFDDGVNCRNVLSRLEFARGRWELRR
jgi:hypothetical protein